jgi:hypothetical protein
MDRIVWPCLLRVLVECSPYQAGPVTFSQPRAQSEARGKTLTGCAWHRRSILRTS